MDIQKMVNVAIDRLKKPGQAGTKSGLRLGDIDDDTLIRGLTEPVTLDLSDRPSHERPRRTLDQIDDEAFVRSITNPATMDLR
jgi:hypothetical protein